MQLSLTKEKPEVLGNALESAFILPVSRFPNPVAKQSGIPEPKPKCSGNPKSQGEMPRDHVIPALGRCRLADIGNGHLGFALIILWSVTFGSKNFTFFNELHIDLNLKMRENELSKCWS